MQNLSKRFCERCKLDKDKMRRRVHSLRCITSDQHGYRMNLGAPHVSLDGEPKMRYKSQCCGCFET